MLRYFVICGFALLSACNQKASTDTSAAEPITTVALLKAGDGSACSRPDVRETIMKYVRRTDSDRGAYNTGDFANGLLNLSYNVDTISLAGTDKSIASVTCDANMIVHNRNHEDKTFSVRYELRPSVEEPSSFIAHSNISEAHDYAVDAARTAASFVQLARAARQQTVLEPAAQQPTQLQATPQTEAQPAQPNETQTAPSSPQDESAPAPTNILPPG